VVRVAGVQRDNVLDPATRSDDPAHDRKERGYPKRIAGASRGSTATICTAT